jgi:signal transduction histidine kinase
MSASGMMVDLRAEEGEVVSGVGHAQGTAVAQMQRVAMLLFLAIRLVCLAEAPVMLFGNLRSYRPAWLAVAVLVTVAVESAVVTIRDLDSGRHGPRSALADAAFSLAGLVVLAHTLQNRAAPQNWMIPYSDAVAAGVGVALPNIVGGLIVMALSVAHVVTTWQDGAHAAISLSNVVFLSGYFVVIALCVRAATRFADGYEGTRQEAIETGERLAAEHERRRNQRLIHDSVLQTLEAMAAGWVGGEGAMRARARAEARRLRAMLDGRPAEQGFRTRLEGLASDVEANTSLRVDVVAEEGIPQPPPEVAAALLAAAREALFNVTKHAAVKSAVVRLRATEGGIRVVVSDRGKGFDPSATQGGFGMEQSIRARLAEVEGRADISSEPGEGTRVSLWGPLA